MSHRFRPGALVLTALYPNGCPSASPKVLIQKTRCAKNNRWNGASAFFSSSLARHQSLRSKQASSICRHIKSRVLSVMLNLLDVIMFGHALKGLPQTGPKVLVSRGCGRKLYEDQTPIRSESSSYNLLHKHSCRFFHRTTQQPLFSPFSNVSSAARVAASKTSSTPSPLKLEHSRYRFAPTSRAAASPSCAVTNRSDFFRISSIATGSSRRSFFKPTRIMGTPVHKRVASSIHCKSLEGEIASGLHYAPCVLRYLTSRAIR